ncbi:hypothetical protein BDY19DRAFT_995230 [Irpex rosettiformis]|uniref:Uncharacterized protein n=1 Tax=Irpex rosettiformis TaxID=378272 RepID=A0ACB8TYL3_9APHY|nr:hypothetical protein BDY19DRAFT_995230 [Irpex rosettiformis]
MVPPPSTPHTPASSRFAPYRIALQSISARTRTPLPSLIFSFAILHELTAVLPLFAIFFGARQLGVGERIVSTVTHATEGGEDNAVKQKGREWVREGEMWAERVGRRYGVFGYEKRVGPKDSASFGEAESVRADGGALSPRLAGDVANTIVAYGLTKALLPARIGVSLYFAPKFSRRVVEPIRGNVMRLFRRKSS